MRELTMNEMSLVAGAGDDCSSGGSGNNLAGISNSESIGQDLINIYEGVVSAASHVIERVANAL
jgi:hypothetical protein